ncbi:MAG TPA: sulfatase, partial [Thermoanaerobaculia bacterium]
MKPLARVAVLLLFAISCSSDSETPRTTSDVPVFLVSIDSVRADRLPAYGYPRGSTPAIDAFRRDAILYRYAFANAPLTLPSHASILTGELPPVHGIRGDVGYKLSPDAGTIATAVRQLGYSTGAAVSSYVLRRETGVGEGFDFYDDRVGVALRPTLSERAGDDSRLALTTWLEATPGLRVFGFLHLNRPHAPHVAPADANAETGSEYDSEISHADGVFGRFVETLKQRGLYEEALIILLSDHGEGLGDHGEEEHGLFVYRESIHVPLLVKLPKSERRGEAVARAVGLNQVRDLVLDVIRGER